MRKFSYLENKEKGKSAIIIGAGSSISKYENEINNFIQKANPITIGINNISSFIVPDYHVWTNTSRFKDFGNSISKKSRILLGENISKKNIKMVLNHSDYYHVSYTDSEKTNYGYDKGKVFGHFRTAGCLSVMLSHIMGVSNIFIVGMDGYTLNSEESLMNNNSSQHFYANGHSDKASWEECVKKDRIAYGILDGIKDYGINFSIITPTKFIRHYDESILKEK